MSSRAKGLIFLLLGIMLLFPGLGLAQKEAVVARLEGPINPATSSYVRRAIEIGEERSAEVIIIEIDTPGGLATSMKSIVKEIMNSRVPVITYVSP
ncbi:MAG: nodulation protein NfeD, partial [Desulfatiglandales bacterium]